MKQIKLLLLIFLFFVLPWVLFSCCRSGKAQPNSNGIDFEFSDYNYRVFKMELIGTNKMITKEMRIYCSDGFNSPRRCDTVYRFPKIELNAEDTVVRFRIFYIKDYVPDSVWNGIITLSYTPKLTTIDYNCGKDMIMAYNNLKVLTTTFTSARVVYGKTIQITH